MKNLCYHPTYISFQLNYCDHRQNWFLDRGINIAGKSQIPYTFYIFRLCLISCHSHKRFLIKLYRLVSVLLTAGFYVSQHCLSWYCPIISMKKHSVGTPMNLLHCSMGMLSLRSCIRITMPISELKNWQFHGAL